MATKKSKASKRTASGPRKMTTPVDPVLFIKTWQQAGSADEAAKKLGVSKTYVSQKAINFRKHDVPLKTMPKGRAKRDYAPLIQLAKSLANAA